MSFIKNNWKTDDVYTAEAVNALEDAVVQLEAAQIPFFVHGTLGEVNGSGSYAITMQETRSDVDAAVAAGRTVVLVADTTDVENEGEENEHTVTNTWYLPLVTKETAEGDTGFGLSFAVSIPSVITVVAQFGAEQSVGTAIVIIAGE